MSIQSQSQEREKKILSFINKVPSDFQDKNDKTKHFIAHLCHLSYFYARISRALLYNYSNLKLEDFVISVQSVSNFRESLKQMMTKVLNLILKRLVYFEKDQSSLIQFYLDKSITQRLTKLSQDIMHHLNISKLDFSDEELQPEIQLMKEQNYTQESQKSKFLEDLTAIENLFKVFVKEEKDNLKDDIVSASQDVEIDTIEPFLGFSGKKSTLVTSYSKAVHIANDDSLKQNDFRGIIASGPSPTIYTAFHGSCQDYDWHANLELEVVSPSDTLLPELPKEWKVMEGYADLIHLSWNAKQDIQQNQQKIICESLEKEYSKTPTFFDLLKQKLSKKKTIFFTGHSQGAGLAHLASAYMKILLPKTDIRGWFISCPRTVDKYTGYQIDKLFEIDQHKQGNKLIRQNMLGDPVPLSQSSSKEFLDRVREFGLIGEILFQELFLHTMNQILADPQFRETLRADTSGILGLIENQFISKFIVEPLYGPKYQGNFAKFLIDFTQDEQDFLMKKFWDIVASHYKETILKYIPDHVQSKLNLTGHLSGQDLRGLLNSSAKILLVEDDKTNVHIQDLLFESQYQHEYQFELLQAQKKKENKGFWHYITDIFSSHKDEDLHQHPIFKQQSTEMILSKRFLKSLLLEQVSQKYIGLKLSLLGEVFEGLMYLTSGYGDTGMLLLDQLDNHEQSKRVQELKLLENFFDSKTDHSLQELHMKTGLKQSVSDIVGYFAPYHYGEGQLGGSFSPSLVCDSQLNKIYGFANYYSSLSQEQQADELLKQGLLKNHKQTLKEQLTHSNDILIMLQRIQAKISYAPYFIEKLYISDKRINKTTFLNIVGKFESVVKNADKLKRSYTEENQYIRDLLACSYFLSSFIKAMEVLYSKSPHDLEKKLLDQYGRFIEEIVEKKEEENLKVLCHIHNKFINNSLDFIRNNHYQK